MFQEAEDDARLLGPKPAWLGRRSFAVWSAGADFVGWVLWGHLGDDGAEDMKQLWLRLAPRLARPYDFVLDLRQLDSVSSGAYTRIREFATAPKRGLKRQAIVVAGERPGGSIQLGLYVLTPPAYEWASFTTNAEAAAWVGREGGAQVLAAVDERTHGRATLPPPLHELRLLLAGAAPLSLPEAARRLSLSTRTLQRSLGELGTSFSDEVDGAMVRRAQELLRDPALKLEAVALELGFANAHSLDRLFRRVTGQSPTDFRREHGL